MKVKTNVKAGGIAANRCEAFVRRHEMKVKTNVKAGGVATNRCEAFVKKSR